MNPVERGKGLLIDTNLLVLFIVGTVNPSRITSFKRARQFDRKDYEFLLQILEQFHTVYTVAHVMAEVSNLTDLKASELFMARHFLKETITLLKEPPVPSKRAAEEQCYESLGLVDAAITAAATKHGCTVLTTDLDLYLSLSAAELPVINFTHVRARAWNL